VKDKILLILLAAVLALSLSIAGCTTPPAEEEETEMQDIATLLGAAWDIIAVSSGESNPAYTWNVVHEETYPFLSWEMMSLLAISTVGLPVGQVGVAYEAALEAAGGIEPYTWAIVDGTLPDGLELDAETGVISGIPTEGDVFEFTVQVTDAGDSTATKNLFIVVLPAVIRGDANGDSVVNVLDMVLIGQHWGQIGSPGWIPEDVMKDGVINVLDMIIVGQHWTG
jgi:predicted RNA-binding protein with TRAM domain